MSQGSGTESADEVEKFAADAGGDGGVFEHGDVDRIDTEADVEIAGDYEATARENFYAERGPRRMITRPL